MLFRSLARTGVRIGEVFALRLEDLDFEAREIRVERAFSAGRIESPKGGRARRVDMSASLCEVLRGVVTRRQADALRAGRGDDPAALVFCTSSGGPLDQSRVSKVLKRVLRRAGLPAHFTPHGLRHTFASLLLQQGESPAYVQRQLGHASIQLTVDTYGRWLPMGNKAAVDGLDDAGGSKMVATAAVEREGREETPEKAGAGERTRTADLLITNQLLYQLSYAGRRGRVHATVCTT